MLRSFGRLIVIPFAALMAALVTAIVIVMLGQERVIQGLGGQDISIDGVLGIGDVFIRIAVATFSVQTLLPILLLIVVGEIGHINSPIYYVIGSGVAIAIIPLIARLGQTGIADASSLWQLFATGGFVGGFVYWLLAGRRA